MNRQVGHRWRRLGLSLVIGMSLLTIFGASLFASSEHGYTEAIEQSNVDFDCSTVTEIPTAECETLVDLYNSTDGPNWVNNTNWLMNDMPCSWSRIECSEGHVSGINMFYNGLNGKLPSFSNLLHLKRLFIWDKELGGEFPQVGDLTELFELSIASPLLTGTLPSMAKLTNLEYLIVGLAQIEGEIPPLTGLVKLRQMLIAETQISGEIPSLQGLDSLEGLGLNGNRLTGKLPNIEGAPLLQSLFLSGNKLHGDIPDSLCNMQVDLDLSFNKITPRSGCEKVYGMETQTLPPTEIETRANVSGTVILNWKPISYTANSGYYEILHSTELDGPFTPVGKTTNKEINNFTVEGFKIGSTHYFAIRTFTPSHGPAGDGDTLYQPNDLTSDYSEIIEVTIPTEPIPIETGSTIYLPAISR